MPAVRAPQPSSETAGTTRGAVLHGARQSSSVRRLLGRPFVLSRGGGDGDGGDDKHQTLVSTPRRFPVMGPKSGWVARMTT